MHNIRCNISGLIYRLIISIFFITITEHHISAGETVTTHWGGNAELVYDTGFMHMLRKLPDGGIGLFDIELIENDSPGAGTSEKGVTRDGVWGKNRARKILYLDDPRAKKAYFLFFLDRQGKYPLHFEVNGHQSQVNTWDPKTCKLFYRWTEFPASWLKKGKNVLTMYCPEAQSAKEGWNLFLARADEFETGGGDPKDVGKTSFKSIDGGETWKESPFGPLGQTRAEYTVRISLDRHIRHGWLASPVIDLWKGDNTDCIVPLREIRKMKLSIRAEVPEDTSIEYFFRKGTSPGPHDSGWEPYQSIGNGGIVDFELEGAELNRRYVQFRMVLSTTNPLKTPVVKSAHIDAELFERVSLYKNIYVVESDNPTIKYSSVDWEWEKWDRPEFKELRERENLDEVVAGSRTDFDAQVKLLDYITKRWRHNSPKPEYPAWDALSILNHLESAGGGGMCIQFNNTLIGMCLAYGWQARLLNVVNHEVCEVWNDEYGKWIFLDADFVNHYNYTIAEAEPQSMLELHYHFLDYYFPDRPIDWMNDWIGWMDPIEGKPVPLKRGSLTHHDGVVLTGFNCSAFMKVLPRNNFYGKPYPMPLNHQSVKGPWNGYINWYNEKSPPKRQYSWHTDRPRDMWPDLNLVHVDATQGFGNDRLFLRFETYTPNFSHFEIDVDDTGWKKTGERWTWLLQSGRNTLRVRAVNKLGAQGKPSRIILNHADAPFGE